jgi:hypothetical protein
VLKDNREYIKKLQVSADELQTIKRILSWVFMKYEIFG